MNNLRVKRGVGEAWQGVLSNDTYIAMRNLRDGGGEVVEPLILKKNEIQSQIFLPQ